MIWLPFLLVLIISLAANGYQSYRWRVYRDKPSGYHSYTGMMPKLTRQGARGKTRQPH